MEVKDYDRKEFVLADYLAELEAEDIVSDTKAWSDSIAESPVKLVTYDSREVVAGSLFICKGKAFKRQYLLDAVEQGAIAYLAEKDMDVMLPAILVSDMRRALSLTAQRYYGWPQRELTVLGITGTKGKSTTVFCLRNILDTYLKGKGEAPVGIISSIVSYEGYASKESVLTTPEPLELFAVMRNAVTAGLKYMILESSSQGLRYHRLDDITFLYGAILNISEDHISDMEHKDFADYKAAKLAMIDHCENLLLDLDIEYSDEIETLAEDKGLGLITLSGKDNHQADFYANNIRASEDGLIFDFFSKNDAERNIKELFISLHGIFNITNALHAVIIAQELGVDEASIRAAMAEVSVPGRMLLYPTDDGAVLGMVDYAHNKLSFEALFDNLDHFYPEHRYIAIFGSTGDKAKNRRPELGRIAGARADYVYLTADDLLDEPFESINADMIPYLDEGGVAWEAYEDREYCIKQAFERALRDYREHGTKSVILALGKGDESSILRRGNYDPIRSDVTVMKELVANYNEGLKKQ